MKSPHVRPTRDGAGTPRRRPRTTRERRAAVAAMFGLDLGRVAPPRSAPPVEALRAARRVVPLLPPGGIALVSGPSGTGKSCVLASLAALLRRRGDAVAVADSPAALLGERAPVLNLFRGELHDELRHLAALGLAEAPLWLRPARDLSEGQRSRLALALACRRASSGARAHVVIADEFTSSLDRVSAMALCFGVRRWVSQRRVRLVVATAHDDVASWLRPDLRVTLHAGFLTTGTAAIELATPGRPA